MKKTLPLADPLITTIPSHANFLSIALLTEKGREWLFNYYVNIYVKFTDSVFRDSCKANFIDWGTLDRNYTNIIKSYFVPRMFVKNIIEFIEESLFNNYYINLRLDLFYLPCCDLYKKSHFCHNVLINCIDTDNNLIIISDFFSGRQYQSYEIDFDSFIRAFNGVTEDLVPLEPDYLFFRTEIQLIKNVDNSFDFSLEHLIQLLIDYSDSKDSTGRFFNTSYIFNNDLNTKTNYVYGIDSINIIAELYCSGRLGIQNIHLLYDRYKSMVLRIEFLIQKYSLDLNEEYMGYKKLEHESLILRNLCLKYIIKNTKKTQIKIKEGYNNIYLYEKKLIKSLIDKLSVLN